MPVGSKSIRSIVHHGRREHDEEVGIGNCGRSSLINQARDLADRFAADGRDEAQAERSEEHTSELQSLMRISYAGLCLKKENQPTDIQHQKSTQYEFYSSKKH